MGGPDIQDHLMGSNVQGNGGAFAISACGGFEYAGITEIASAVFKLRDVRHAPVAQGLRSAGSLFRRQ